MFENKLGNFLFEFDTYENIMPKSHKETLNAFNSIFSNGHASYRKFLVSKVGLATLEVDTKNERSRLEEK